MPDARRAGGLAVANSTIVAAQAGESAMTFHAASAPNSIGNTTNIRRVSRGTSCLSTPTKHRWTEVLLAADLAETNQRRQRRSEHCAPRNQEKSCRDTAISEAVPYPCGRFGAAIHQMQVLVVQHFCVYSATIILDFPANRSPRAPRNSKPHCNAT